MDNSKTKRKQYTRRFYIDLNDGHVIEKLRERAPGLASSTFHRSDEDLANWLDSKIVDAIHLGNVQVILDNDGVESQIVDLHESTGYSLYALLKPERGRPKEYSQRVMTILTHEQGEHSFQSGKWKATKRVGTLGQKLLAAVAAAPPPPKEPIVPKRVEKTAPKPPEPARELHEVQITLIKYTFNDETTYEEYERGSEDLKNRLAALHGDDSVSHIRVFHEAQVKVKRTITVEVE
jgi:hypothetical protein